MNTGQSDPGGTKRTGEHMTIPEFTDDLITGFDEVDQQHRRLFQAARRVLDARTTGREAVLKALRFLLSYVRYHFEAEEHAMRASAFPGQEIHHLQHDLIRKDVDTIRKALIDGRGTDLLLAMIQAIFQDWLLPHIREVDIQFARHVKQQAGSGAQQPVLPSPDTLDTEGRLPIDFDWNEWKKHSS
jgi:hemerythrin-like metal-binding protein